MKGERCEVCRTRGVDPNYSDTASRLCAECWKAQAKPIIGRVAQFHQRLHLWAMAASGVKPRRQPMPREVIELTDNVRRNRGRPKLQTIQ